MILPLATLMALVLAGPAAAHGTLPGGTGFQAGALHPLVATDHLLALLVAGLAIGRAEGRAVAIGVMALLAGLGLGLLPGAIPDPAPGAILLTALLLGGLLLWGRTLPTGVIAPPVLILGWAIAADTDMPPGAGLSARAGLVVAAALILLNLAALSQWAGARWPLVPRIAGSWALAIALMVLALRGTTPSGLTEALP
ncbi:MAG: HupE/UreJ family protein [Gemmobacter sp.]